MSSYPGIPGGNPAPFLFQQGDGRSQFAGGAALQGFVLDVLTPGTTYQVKIVIEHPAGMYRDPYIEQGTVTITVPSTGVNGGVTVQQTTPTYVPQLRAQNAQQGNFTSRPEI
ncbi:hypothetical protein VWT79_22180, partial [Xanthomonas citri pv. citri]